MMDINKYNDKGVYILRREPFKIYSFSVIMIIMLILFIIIGFCYKYTKYKYYIASVVVNDGELYLYTTVTSEYFNKINKSKLTIDNEEYNFELIEFEQNFYDNNYNIVLKVYDIDLQDKKYITFSLKQEETTLFKEIYKRVKEDFS